ncbi:hypothetical protein HKI87_08g53020 [Chloropicon roscoffensis]|uniref:Uncharacterized protein n=1 Tax=Chloropicon roscoffensis TaxID=1461544 RepID=A0AAX4PD74_9CHLO
MGAAGLARARGWRRAPPRATGLRIGEGWRSAVDPRPSCPASRRRWGGRSSWGTLRTVWRPAPSASAAGGSVSVDHGEWKRVEGLTERSMFAALTALVYLVGFSFRLEGYMGYILPLPIILMGVRHGARSCWSTLALISVLQTVLFGPVRAASFVCVHGFYSAVLATFWSKSLAGRGDAAAGRGWLAIILVTAVSRVVGLVGSIFLLSWLIGDNILALIFSGIENLFEQFFSVVGLPYLQFPLPTGLLATTFFGLAVLSSTAYVAIIYYMHASVVYKTSGKRVPMPAFFESRLNRRRPSGV